MEYDLNIIAQQQMLNELLTKSEPSTKNQHELLMLQHVFKFIHKNFSKLNDAVLMDDVLKVLHYSLRLELQMKSSLHVGSFVYALLKVNNENSEESIHKCLQILYQILKTLTIEDTQCLQIGNEIFLKLVEILLENSSPANSANILVCLKLYANKFNATCIITHLWSSIKNGLNTNQITENTAILQTLIHFFDEFLLHVEDFRQSTEFTQLVQRLLDSEHHDHRKSAYFLLKKAHHIMEKQLMTHLAVSRKQEFNNTTHFWSVCITTFENLEENQSHLILPTLETLRTLNISDLREQIWLNILYRQILRHNNIMVRRWILEHLLGSLSYFSLINETQVQFMQAINETALYNAEGYMLPVENMGKFLTCNKKKFLITFSDVKWKAVPLHYWLGQLILHWKSVNASDMSQEVLLQLATKIRAMQNTALRRENIRLFQELCFPIINEMEIASYVALVESLYNTSDPYDNKEFFIKLKSCKALNFDGDGIFSLRFYKILTNNICTPDSLLKTDEICSDLNAKLDLNGWTMGYLRYTLFDCLSERTAEFLAFSLYHDTLTSDLLQMSLNELYNFFDQFAKTKDEKILSKQKVTDFYVTHYISSYVDLMNKNINPIDLLSVGSAKTLLRLTSLLSNYFEDIGTAVLDCFIDSFREHFKNSNTYTRNICNYFLKYITVNSSRVEWNYVEKLLVSNDVTVVDIVTKKIKTIPSDFLVNYVLNGEAKVGDSRIEEAYECLIVRRLSKPFSIRYAYLQFIKTKQSDEEKKLMLKALCNIIERTNAAKKRYFSNSKEHRLITRILFVIIEILSKVPIGSVEDSFSTKLLLYLMQHNNQKNVKILYEIAISTITPWETIFSHIETQLKHEQCTASQHVSMIAILNRSLMLKPDPLTPADLEKVSSLLWPLTMGSDFQTRLCSQLALSALFDEFKKRNNAWNSYRMPESLEKLNTVLKASLSDAHVGDFAKDIRFKSISLQNAFNEVMAFTNAPYDEYDFILFPSPKSESCSGNANIDALGNFIVQRKLNPSTDFLPYSNLKSYPDSVENVLYVVASLIDKIPNLGGIARTCEVFGIKNLVISSKAHAAKGDFQNLSMTAEKNLVIKEVKPAALMEFILQKKTEGFKIIGAEQTANSCSFVNFAFPKRSVLLLGHEKEGIPPNLLGFLDYAVEIPQFGMVRSLNVHVTGALFIWEYCKQHIVKS